MCANVYISICVNMCVCLCVNCVSSCVCVCVSVCVSMCVRVCTRVEKRAWPRHKESRGLGLNPGLVTLANDFFWLNFHFLIHKIGGFY